MSATTIAHLRARIYEVLCDGAGIVRPLLRFPPAGLIGDWPLGDATTVGGNVTALVDSSGNGNDLAIAGSGVEVTLATDDDYGGQTVGIFGGGKYLTRASLTGGNEGQPITILALGEWTSGDGAMAGGSDVSTEGPFAIIRVSGEVGLVQASSPVATSTLADATPAAVLGTFDGAASSLRIGSDWTSAETGETSANSLAGITIGALPDGTFALTGKVARVAAWDHRLDETERKVAAGYLVGKYEHTVAPFEDRRFQRLRTTRGDRSTLSTRAKVKPIVHVSIVGASDEEVVDEFTDSHLYRCTVRVTRYYHLGYESAPDTVDATLSREFDDMCRVRAVLSHPANLVTLEDGTATGLGGSSLRPRGPTEGDDPDDVGSGADRLLERIDTFAAEFSFDPDA